MVRCVSFTPGGMLSTYHLPGSPQQFSEVEATVGLTKGGKNQPKVLQLELLSQVKTQGSRLGRDRVQIKRQEGYGNIKVTFRKFPTGHPVNLVSVNSHT